MAVLFNIVISVAIILIFLRFLVQLAGLERGNPLVQTTYKVTGWMDSFNRTLPAIGQGRINLAALLLLLLLFLLRLWGMNTLGSPVEIFDRPYHTLHQHLDGLLLGTLMTMTESVLSFVNVLVFAAIISSWVTMFSQRGSVYVDTIQQLAEPLFAPFRKLLPNTGMIDLSPILMILALNIVSILMSDGVAPVVMAGYY